MGLHGLTFTLGFLFGWYLRWPKQRAERKPAINWHGSKQYVVEHPLFRRQRGDY